MGFVPPKEYVVKAADGKTDLWATMFFPYNFDPKKKYPVVEYIYGGPQTMRVHARGKGGAAFRPLLLRNCNRIIDPGGTGCRLLAGFREPYLRRLALAINSFVPSPNDFASSLRRSA